MTSFERQLELLRAKMRNLIEEAEPLLSAYAGKPSGPAPDNPSLLAAGKSSVPLRNECAIPPANGKSAGDDPLAIGREELPDDLTKRQDDEANAVRVRVICNMTRATAKCVGSPQQFHPDWVEAETKLYEERKREAIALAESIGSEALRQEALEQVLGFCVEARDMREAERLLCKVSESVRTRVISSVPTLDMQLWSEKRRELPPVRR